MEQPSITGQPFRVVFDEAWTPNQAARQLWNEASFNTYSTSSGTAFYNANMFPASEGSFVRAEATVEGTRESNWNTYWADYMTASPIVHSGPTAPESIAPIPDPTEVHRFQTNGVNYWYNRAEAQASRQFDREQEIPIWTGRAGYYAFQEVMREAAREFIPEHPRTEAASPKPFSFLSSIETEN